MIINPPNVSWIQEQIPSEIYTYLLSKINKATVNNKHNLVGHISKSLLLPDEEKVFTRYLLDKCKDLEYIDVTGNHVDLWVNFQKKGEYNPSHIHGGQVSFVLWMKIPYTQENEKKTKIATDINTPCLNGSFEITYADLLGSLQRYSFFLDKSAEGVILIFPAQTQHCVYPFYTSDEERISISGNLN